MRVLVACEESQAVANAFRDRGHEAYSCDLIPCSGGHSEYHLQCDALKGAIIRDDNRQHIKSIRHTWHDDDWIEVAIEEWRNERE